jgi:hypothetical protein
MILLAFFSFSGSVDEPVDPFAGRRPLPKDPKQIDAIFKREQRLKAARLDGLHHHPGHRDAGSESEFRQKEEQLRNRRQQLMQRRKESPNDPELKEEARQLKEDFKALFLSHGDSIEQDPEAIPDKVKERLSERDQRREFIQEVEDRKRDVRNGREIQRVTVETPRVLHENPNQGNIPKQTEAEILGYKKATLSSSPIRAVFIGFVVMVVVVGLMLVNRFGCGLFRDRRSGRLPSAFDSRQ